jgi:hypothetical protein
MDSGGAIGTGYALIKQMSNDDPQNVVISRGADIGILSGIGLLFLASSIYGYEVTTSCHDLKRGIIKEPSSPGAFPAPLDEDEKCARRREPDPFAPSQPRRRRTSTAENRRRLCSHDPQRPKRLRGRDAWEQQAQRQLPPEDGG